MPELGEFEGRTITKTTIALRKAGDGLSKAQEVDPVILRQGDTVYVVCKATVGTIAFKPDDEDAVERHTALNVDSATVMDDDVVKNAIAAQEERIQLARDEAEGIKRLPTEDVLRSEHDAGLHAFGPVDGCPLCEGAP